MLLAHKIELYPTIDQMVYLDKACGSRRHCYNQLLNHFSDKTVKWSKKFAANVYKSLRSDFEWYSEVSQRVTRNTIDDLDNAFKHFFRRVKISKKPGFPKFKKKNINDSFSLREQPKFDIRGRWIRIEKLKTLIKLRQELRFDGIAKQITISKRAGKYFVSILVETNDYNKVAGVGSVGVDLGIKNLATLSDGVVISANQKLKDSLVKLSKLQRKLSRKQNGCMDSNVKYSDMRDYLYNLNGSTVQVIFGAAKSGKTTSLLYMCIEMVKSCSCKRILLLSSYDKKVLIDSLLEQELDIKKIGINDYRAKIGVPINSDLIKIGDYVDVIYCEINDSVSSISYGHQLMNTVDVESRSHQAIFILEHLNCFYGSKNIYNKVKRALRGFHKMSIKYNVDIFVELPSKSKEFSFEILVFWVTDYLSNVFKTSAINYRASFDKFFKNILGGDVKKDESTLITTDIILDNGIEVSFIDKGVNEKHHAFVVPFMGWL